MALKKLPKSMSYEAVRYKHPPTPNHAPASEPGPAPVGGAGEGKAIDPSEAGQKERATAPVDHAAPDVGIPHEPLEDPARADRSQPRRKADSRSAAPRDTAADGSVRVRGYVRVPATGDHPDFDELREIYGEKEALGLALSHGLAFYEAALRDTAALERVARPERRSRRVEASRTMPQDLYLKAIAHLDPKAMLGRSQIGSRILDVALTRYLEQP